MSRCAMRDAKREKRCREGGAERNGREGKRREETRSRDIPVSCLQITLARNSFPRVSRTNRQANSPPR